MMEHIQNWPQAFAAVGIALCVTAVIIAIVVGLCLPEAD